MQDLKGTAFHPVKKNIQKLKKTMQSVDRPVRALLPGCARGEIVVPGTVSVPLPDTEADLFQMLMTCVEDDDFHAILELTRRDCTIVDSRRKCVFSVKLRDEQNDPGIPDSADAMPDEMSVEGANLLHYAVSIGKFDACAALLVVCPELLREQCHVAMIQNRSSTFTYDGITSHTNARTVLCVMTWSVIDFTSFFCGLYDTTLPIPGEQADEVQETLQQYKIAFAVCSICEFSLGYGLLFGYGPRERRIAQAGCDAEAFMHNLHWKCFYSSKALGAQNQELRALVART